MYRFRSWARSCARLQVLPQQWVAAEGQSHVQIQIMAMLQRLVNVLGVECTQAYPILGALLPFVLDTSKPEVRGRRCPPKGAVLLCGRPR